MKHSLMVAALITAACLLPSAALAQDAVPQEIMTRTFFIKWGNEAGTAFSLDYLGKIYLITAKHVVSGVPDSGAVLQVHVGDKWEEYKTTKTIYPSSKVVDIAIFGTDEKAQQKYQIEPMGKTGGVTFGQQVWFIGYPFGISTSVQGRTLPFLKRGTMSAMDTTNPDAMLLYIDGFNNPGFSGGPIIFWDFSLHKYEILGVVQGYRNDTAKEIVNGQQVDTQILVNSGILVGYSIQHAVDAIKASLETAQ